MSDGILGTNNRHCDDDRSYIALFSALEHTHCAFFACGSRWATVAFYSVFWISTKVVTLQCHLVPTALSFSSSSFVWKLQYSTRIWRYSYTWPLVEFIYIYLVFTRTPGESYHRRLRSFLLSLFYVSRALVRWFYIPHIYIFHTFIHVSYMYVNDALWFVLLMNSFARTSPQTGLTEPKLQTAILIK